MVWGLKLIVRPLVSFLFKKSFSVILGLLLRVLISFRNPLAQMEEEKREHEAKMKKMEAEMEQVFEMKVKEKKQKLKDSELELTRRHEERKKVRDTNFLIFNGI